MKVVVLFSLFTLFISNSAFSKLNCDDFQIPGLKDACLERLKLKENYLELSRPEYKIKKAQIMAKVLIAQGNGAIFTVQSAAIFNVITPVYTKKFSFFSSNELPSLKHLNENSTSVSE